METTSIRTSSKKAPKIRKQWGKSSSCQIFCFQEEIQIQMKLSIKCYWTCRAEHENNHIIEVDHFLSDLMLKNSCTVNVIHGNVCVCLASLINQEACTHLKNHPLTSQLPDRMRKIHGHPRCLGEVHLFPDVRCCCSLLLWQGIKAEACVWGTNARWRTESSNTLDARRKRRGLPFDTPADWRQGHHYQIPCTVAHHQFLPLRSCSVMQLSDT